MVTADSSTGKVYVKTSNSVYPIHCMRNPLNYGSWVDFGTPDVSSTIVGVNVSLSKSALNIEEDVTKGLEANALTISPSPYSSEIVKARMNTHITLQRSFQEIRQVQL